jgi:PAS domain S-box-containing protein
LQAHSVNVNRTTLGMARVEWRPCPDPTQRHTRHPHHQGRDMIETPAPSSLPPSHVAAALLQAAPAPVLWLDATGCVTWLNAAAAQALGVQATAATGLPLAGLFEPALPPEALDAPASAGPCTAVPAARPTQPLALQAAPLPDGTRVVTLSPAVPAQAQRVSELLDLARDFGRLGVWERDVRTLRGHWDPKVMQLWGLDPAQGTPDFDDAVRAIVEPDRSELDRVFRASLRQAGRYACRFRVLGADGRLRRIHSQWLVKDGPDGQPATVTGIMMDDTELFAAAQELASAESQLSLAVELAGIGLWRQDLEADRVFLNAQGWRLLDLPPREDGLPMERVRELIHPDDFGPALVAARQAGDAAGPVDIEARHRLRDGSWRLLLTRRVAQRDTEGRITGFAGVVMDITEREAARRRSEALLERFELVSAAAGIGWWTAEPGTASVVWSPRLRELFGLGPDDPIPGNDEWVPRFVVPEDRQRVQAEFDDWTRSGGEELRLEYRIVAAQGQPRQLLTQSRLQRVQEVPMQFGVVIDVTESRSAAQALRAAHQRVALAVQGAGLGTWESRLDDGIDFWDEAMWRLRGRTPQARAPGHAERTAMVHPEDRDGVARQNMQAMQHHQPTDMEFRVVWPDGQVRWLASRAATLFDEGGRPVRRIGVNWDITDRRTAADARQESELARRESQAKSRFLSRMSHELRTPLNAVLGFTELLHAEDIGSGPEGQRRRERLGHVRQAGQHLLSLINDVLELSTLEGGEVRIQRRPVALAPMLAATLPLVAAQAQAMGVTLRTGALDLPVLADATRLRQVLLNLLSNAIKYNRPGGQVEASAEAEPGGMVCLRITDTGRGMSAWQLRHLFEPFNRLGAEGQSVEGTGIGLAIVKALVERMGGSIRVRSREGAGSTFEVRLLAAAQDAPGVAAAADAAADVRPQDSADDEARAPRVSRRLLYVEDNAVNALILRELAAQRGDLLLEVAVDGRSGVAAAVAAPPDLVLLDMQLPDIDGLAVLKALREHPATQRVPCIALSANAMPEEIASALGAGMADYWTKPLDFAVFNATMNALFGPAPGRRPRAGT